MIQMFAGMFAIGAVVALLGFLGVGIAVMAVSVAVPALLIVSTTALNKITQQTNGGNQ